MHPFAFFYPDQLEKGILNSGREKWERVAVGLLLNPDARLLGQSLWKSATFLLERPAVSLMVLTHIHSLCAKTVPLPLLRLLGRTIVFGSSRLCRAIRPVPAFPFPRTIRIVSVNSRGGFFRSSAKIKSFTKSFFQMRASLKKTETSMPDLLPAKIQSTGGKMIIDKKYPFY